MEDITGGFEIDISSVRHGYQGLQHGRRTNRSFG